MRNISSVYLATLVSILSLVAVGCSSDSGGDDDPNMADARALPDSSIAAPSLEWTWLEVPGTKCMDGSETGMAVNLNPASDKVMVYLEGGGACFNAFTCSGVAHQNGFKVVDFNAFKSQSGSAGVFNRSDDDNPFKDWNHVFIPYCSGDIFAGNNMNGAQGRVQVGYTNMGLYTAELTKAFGGAGQVVLTGSSAGGFGASYNYDRVQTAFGSTPVTLLNDSGPPMSDKYMTPCLQTQIRDVWNLDDTLPPDCTACKAANGGGLVNMVTHLATKYPNSRSGIISSTTDGVIRLFYGWGYPSCSNPTVPMPEAAFSEGLADLRDNVLAPYDNMQVFTINSGLHVWLLENPIGSTVSGGTKLTDWVRGLLDDRSGWDDVIP